MEYLEGRDLKRFLRENGGTLTAEQTLEIASYITDALIIVHSANILHRDISPDNIYMCADGRIKLIDFGAARQVVGRESQSLSVIFKQGFAPLEQYQKKGNHGPWTDIYALGATMYYALTGKVIDDAMTRLANPDLDMTGIPTGLAAVLSKMLMVQERDRFQSAIELKRALSALEVSMDELPDGVQPALPHLEEVSALEALPQTEVQPLPPIGSPAPQTPKRRGALAQVLVIAIAAVLIAGIFAFVFFTSGDRKKGGAADAQDTTAVTQPQSDAQESLTQGGTTKPGESQTSVSSSEAGTEQTKQQIIVPSTKPSETKKQKEPYKTGTGNAANGNGMCEYYKADGTVEYVYYVDFRDNSTIYRMKPDASEKQRVANVSATRFLLVGSTIFFANRDDDYTLYRMTLSGDSVQKVCDDQPYSMYSDGKWLYYRAFNQENSLCRIRVNGTKHEQLTDFPVAWFLFEDDTLYFADKADSYYYRMNPDGSDKRLLTKSQVYLPTFYDGRIYFSDADAAIWSMKPDGTDMKAVIEDAGYYFNVCQGHVFFLSLVDEYVYSADLNGKNLRKVQKLPGMSNESGVDTQYNAIYTTENAIIVCYGTANGYQLKIFRYDTGADGRITVLT